jgi:predicted transcriptional regulator
MKHQNETPLYATVFYGIRQELGISWAEYIYLDMVYHLSKDGWCYKSLDNVAKDMGMAKSGVVKMRTRLIEKGLLKKSIKGYVKTTVMYHKVIRTDSQPYHKVNKPYHKVARSVPLSDTKNNNRTTIESDSNDFRGKPSPNKDIVAEAVRTKNWSLLRKVKARA